MVSMADLMTVAVTASIDAGSTAPLDRPTEGLAGAGCVVVICRPLA
jgi:hypothetical protein